MQLKPNFFDLSEDLGKTFDCNCGKRHSTNLEFVDVSSGALHQIPDLLKRFGCTKAFMVSDKNTYAAAGKQVEQLVKDSGCGLTSCIFSEDFVVPDERSLGELLNAYCNDCDFIIAVGTGTINDMCKYFSYKLKLSYMIVATAPSMDGFASNGAAMIIKNMKVTFEAQVPKAIVADVDILCKAPQDMVSAGLADLLGKYTSLCDWKLSHLINGEYYCETIAELVKKSVKSVLNEIDAIESRKPSVIAHLTEALILSGVAMSYVGNSRPASGSEHHISHFWEMRFLMEGKKPVLHGTKVGIGTIASLKAYSLLLKRKADFQAARRKAEDFNLAQWKQDMQKVYGQAAEGVIALEEETQKNSPQGHQARLASIEKRYDEILQLIRTTLPDYHWLEELLTKLSAPVNPAQLGIAVQTVTDSIVAAKEVRNRYTVLQLLWDLGLLQEVAEEISSYFNTAY